MQLEHRTALPEATGAGNWAAHLVPLGLTDGSSVTVAALPHSRAVGSSS